MKTLILASVLSSATFSQEKVNLREYIPIDDFIEPKIYVFSDEEMEYTHFERYRAIPLEKRDTLLITEIYGPDLEYMGSTHEIFTTNGMRFINQSGPDFDARMKGNNRFNHQQVIGKTKKYKAALYLEGQEDMTLDLSFTVLNTSFEIIDNKSYETITMEFKQESNMWEEPMTSYVVAAKGLGYIVRLNKPLYQILTDREFEETKCSYEYK